MARLWDHGQESSNNVLGRSGGKSGVIELSKELAGGGTPRVHLVKCLYLVVMHEGVVALDCAAP
jgi:hypothetical protein